MLGMGMMMVGVVVVVFGGVDVGGRSCSGSVHGVVFCCCWGIRLSSDIEIESEDCALVGIAAEAASWALWSSSEKMHVVYIVLTPPFCNNKPLGLDVSTTALFANF